MRIVWVQYCVAAVVLAAGACGTNGKGSGIGTGGTSGASSGGGGTTPSDTSPPTRICDEPTPWTLPAARQTVGNGTAASCTADALKQAVASGGYVTFNCGDAPVSIAISTAIQVGKETALDGEGRITLDGGGTSQIFVVTSKLSVRNLRFINGKAANDASGGAVSGGWRSNVEVIGCTFEDNTAGTSGGAVAVGTGSSLTVVRSQFRRNHSGYGGGGHL